MFQFEKQSAEQYLSELIARARQNVREKKAANKSSLPTMRKVLQIKSAGLPLSPRAQIVLQTLDPKPAMSGLNGKKKHIRSPNNHPISLATLAAFSNDNSA